MTTLPLIQAQPPPSFPSTTTRRRTLAGDPGPTFCEACITEIHGQMLLAAGEDCYTYVQIQYGGLCIFTPFASTPRVSLGLATRGRTAASFDPQFPNPVWSDLGPRCPFYWQSDHLSLPAVEFTVWARPKALVETLRARIKKKKLAIQELLETSSSSSSCSGSSASRGDGSSSDSGGDVSGGRHHRAWENVSGMPSTLPPSPPPRTAAPTDPLADHCAAPEVGDRFVGYARVRLEVGMLSQPLVVVRLGTRGQADEPLLRQFGTLGSLAFTLRPSPTEGVPRPVPPTTGVSPGARSGVGARGTQQVTATTSLPKPRRKNVDAATAVRLTDLASRGSCEGSVGGGRGLRLNGPMCTLRAITFQPLSAVLSPSAFSFLREWERKMQEKRQYRQDAVVLLHPIAQEEWRRARETQRQSREQASAMGHRFYEEEVEDALHASSTWVEGPLIAKESLLQLTMMTSPHPLPTSPDLNGLLWSSSPTSCNEIVAEPSRKGLWKRHLRRKREFMDALCPPAGDDGVTASHPSSASHHRHRRRRPPPPPHTLGDRFDFSLPHVELSMEDLLSVQCVVSRIPNTTHTGEGGVDVFKVNPPKVSTCYGLGPLRLSAEDGVRMMDVGYDGPLTLLMPCYARDARGIDAGPVSEAVGDYEACGWLTWTLVPSPDFDVVGFLHCLQERRAADNKVQAVPQGKEDGLRVPLTTGVVPSSVLHEVPPPFSGHLLPNQKHLPSCENGSFDPSCAPPLMENTCGASVAPPPTGGFAVQIVEALIPNALWEAAAPMDSRSPCEVPTATVVGTLNQPGPRVELFVMEADSVGAAGSLWVPRWGACTYVVENCGPSVEGIVIEIHRGPPSTAQTAATCVGRYAHHFASLSYVGGGSFPMNTVNANDASANSPTMIGICWNTSPEAKQRQMLHELQIHTDKHRDEVSALIASHTVPGVFHRTPPPPSPVLGEHSMDVHEALSDAQTSLLRGAVAPHTPTTALDDFSCSAWRARHDVVSSFHCGLDATSTISSEVLTLRVQLLALINASAPTSAWGHSLAPYAVLQVGQLAEDSHSLHSPPIRLRPAGATAEAGADVVSPMTFTSDFVFPRRTEPPPLVTVEIREVHSHAVFGTAAMTAPHKTWKLGIAKTDVLRLRPPPTKGRVGEGAAGDPEEDQEGVGELIVKMTWMCKSEEELGSSVRRQRELSLRVLGGTGLYTPGKKIPSSCYLLASVPTEGSMSRSSYRSSVIMNTANPFWYLQLPRLTMLEPTESVELCVRHCCHSESGEAEDVCLGVASLPLGELLRLIRPPPRQRAWAWGALASAVLNTSTHKLCLDLHSPPDGPEESDDSCGSLLVEWEVEETDPWPQSSPARSPHVLELFVESARSLAVAPPRQGTRSCVAVAVYVEELGPSEVCPVEVLRTGPRSSASSGTNPCRLCAELVADDCGGPASAAFFGRIAPTRLKLDLPSGEPHHLRLELWASAPQPQLPEEAGRTAHKEGREDAVAMTEFLGVATFTTSAVSDPAMSAMQEPRRFELTLLPRRDPRHGGRDVQRANAFAGGLGTVVVGIGLYPEQTYAVRQRQLLSLHGLGYRLELQVPTSQGLESEYEAYHLSLTCVGNPSLSCLSDVVWGPNPVFDGLCLPLQCPLELVELRLLRAAGGASSSIEDDLVGVVTFAVEGPPTSGDEGSGDNGGGCVGFGAPLHPQMRWLSLEVPRMKVVTPREEGSPLTSPFDRRVLVQWRVIPEGPVARQASRPMGSAALGERRLSSNTLLSNVSDGTRVPHHNPSSTDASVSAHPPDGLAATRSGHLGRPPTSPSHHTTTLPFTVIESLALLDAATGQHLIFPVTGESTVEDALVYAYGVLQTDDRHPATAQASAHAFVAQHRLMIMDVAHGSGRGQTLAAQDILHSSVPPGALVLLCSKETAEAGSTSGNFVTPVADPSTSLHPLPPASLPPNVVSRGPHLAPFGYRTPGSSVRTCSLDSRNPSTRHGMICNRTYCLHRCNARILERLRTLVEVEKQDTRLTSCIVTLSWMTVDSSEVQWLMHQALQCGISGFCRPVPLPLPAKLAPLTNFMEDSPPHVTRECAATAMLRRSPVKGHSRRPEDGVATMDAVEFFVQGLSSSILHFLQHATVAPGVALFPPIDCTEDMVTASKGGGGAEDGAARPNTAQLEQVEGWIPILRNQLFHIATTLPEAHRCFSVCAEPATSDNPEEKHSPNRTRESSLVWFYHEDPLGLFAVPGTDQPRPMLLSHYPLRTATSSVTSQSHSEWCSAGEEGLEGRVTGVRRMDERGENRDEAPAATNATSLRICKAPLTENR